METWKNIANKPRATSPTTTTTPATAKKFLMGSTVCFAAVPPRSGSDGSSGGVPLNHNTPSLHKPAVLVTFILDPSQGTPGTAISAHPTNTGAVPSRARRHRFRWITGRLERMQTELYGKYLASRLLALLYRSMLRYLRLVVRSIDIGLEQLFHPEALPYAPLTRSVHDRRYALFRRRAVRIN